MRLGRGLGREVPVKHAGLVRVALIAGRGLQTSRTPADGVLTTLRIVSRSTPVCANEFMPMKWL
jgi:hypothetical protein